MAGNDSGPFYVVLGGKKPGVYEARPPNTMLGAPKILLPIVVIVTNRQDAETIFTLHEAIFKVALPEDAHTMVWLLQREPATTIDADLEVTGPMYAVRSGLETGVYLGFEWGSIERFVTPPAQGKKTFLARWEGFSQLSNALIFMLKKPGANLPLVPSGSPFPRPPTRTKEVRFDFSGVPEPEQTDETVAPTPGRSASPVKSSVVPSSRAASPVKALSGAGMSASTSRAAAPTSRSTREVNELSAAFREMHGATTGLEFLRRLLRPPPTMGGSVNPPLPPFMLGEQADLLFMSSGLDAHELVTLLQVRVHARTVEAFTHHVGLMLGWSTRDAARIWDLMVIPDV